MVPLPSVVKDDNLAIDELAMNSEQIFAILSGKDFWRTRDIPELGIGALKFTDGPNGARGERWTEGAAAICFPCSTALGASFDQTLLRDIGKAIAVESLKKNANGLLAPTVNLHRYLLNGRNFESFSEDPHLSGYLAGQYVAGVQSENVAACPKHFLANEAENGRRWSDSVIDERTLRELYLEPFRIIIKEAAPLCLMTSYNALNGEYCSESQKLLDIVRNEWNYEGIIISDWFGTYSTSKALNAGLDLEMPGPTKFRTKEHMSNALAKGEIEPKKVAASLKRIIKTLRATKRIGLSDPVEARGQLPELSSVPDDAVKDLLRRAAADSMVLLSNKNSALPLPSGSEIAIIGQPAADPSIFGGGSASLAPAFISKPLPELLRDFPHATYSPGVSVQRLVGPASLLRAPESDIKLEWYNSVEPDQKQLFRSEIIPGSEYMMMEDIHEGLADLRNFTTSMTMTIKAPLTGKYKLSMTGPGTQTAYLDGVKVANASRGSEVVTEDYIFNRANLEATFVLHDELQAGREYHLRVICQSSKHSIKHINREFYVQGGRVGLAVIPNEEQRIKEPQEVAASSAASLIFVGTTPQWESEGFDRVSYQLPGEQNALIKGVAAASKGPTIVVINSGSPIDMTPWIDSVDAVLQVWFPGQEYGTALSDIITGRVSPSGRLPTTVPRSLEGTGAGDLSAITNTPPGLDKKLVYKEGLRVGYRAYAAGHIEENKREWYNPLFAFGHGLSFSEFTYMDVERRTIINDNTDISIDVLATVRNIGRMEAAEVVQVYVEPLNPSTDRPEVELRGFGRTARLASGKEQRMRFGLTKEAFSFWDVIAGRWKVEAGEYRVLFAGAGGVGDWVPGVTVDVGIKKDFWWSG